MSHDSINFMDRVSAEVRDWFWTIVNQARTGAESKVIEMIDWKVSHTERVIDWGEKIMADEKEGWDLTKGITACLLHDIGRFPQATMGTYVDAKSINHALKGKQLVEAAKIDEIDDQIIESVAEHNNPYYNGKNIYVKLVRDADQMAIIEELKWQIRSASGYYRDSGGVGEVTKQKYLEKKVIDTSSIVTLGEWFCCVKSWKQKFNFGSTRKLYYENGFDEKINNKYKELFPDSETEEIFEN